MKTKSKSNHQALPTDYLNRLYARNPAERDLLRSRAVFIVGAGSVGSAIAMMAARGGTERLILGDRECITPENLSRHFADSTQVGMPKAEAVKACIERINPHARVTTLTADFRTLPDEQLLPWLHEKPLLIGTTDSFAAQSRLNLLSLAYELPAIFVGCWGAAQTGEVFCSLPGRTACFECYAGFRREYELLSLEDERRYTEPDFDESRAPSQAGLWPNVLTIASFAFQVALGVLGCPARLALLDNVAERPLWLVNQIDLSSGLPPFSVTPAQVRRGCLICQPEAELNLDELWEETIWQSSTH
jgi:hypothetical protein